MVTLRDIRRPLVFDDWASTRVLLALQPIEADGPGAVATLAHVMAAKRIWQARVTGGVAPLAVNPDLTLAAIRDQLREAHDEWSRYLDESSDAGLDAVVRYSNVAGEPFESTLGDILTHLAIHGQHHRRQCLAAIRQAGFTPPTIDFIHATRSGAVA